MEELQNIVSTISMYLGTKIVTKSVLSYRQLHVGTFSFVSTFVLPCVHVYYMIKMVL